MIYYRIGKIATLSHLLYLINNVFIFSRLHNNKAATDDNENVATDDVVEVKSEEEEVVLKVEVELE